ncbi:MAG: hypothetical protein M3370_11465 [Actinomycetota bacterium]|nr:hypothetical protein [Actinomycetota bacterium]
MIAFRLAFAAAVIAAVLTTPARAEAPWSSPSTVTVGNPQLAEPTIAFGGDGRGLLSARITTKTNGVPSRGFSRLFAEQGDGSFSGRGRLVLAAPPAVYGKTRTALLRLPLAQGDLTATDLDRPQSSMGNAFGRTDGTFSAYRRFTTRADRTTGAIAADDRGDVAAMWIEHREGRDQLLVAIRRPNRDFARPTVIAGSGFLSSPVVAWSAGGDLLVAYQRSVTTAGRTERRVEARVRRAGHSWGAAQRLGRSSGFSDIAVAAAPNGRMVVAWGTQDLGIQADTPWIVRAAMRPAGPRSFRAAQQLDVGDLHERPVGRVATAMAPDGTATVAWSRMARTRSGPQAATANSTLRFKAAQQLSPSGAVGDVAVSRDGTALVVWSTPAHVLNDETSAQVFANLRPARQQTFAAPEAVGPPEGAHQPRAAFDPRTGRPAVVWIAQPDTQPDAPSQPGSQTQLLRYAHRTG